MRIPLRRRDGSVRAYAVVDAVDFARFGGLRWSAHSGGYAYRWERQADGSRYCQLLHRAVVGLERGDPREADHENRDRLDCRRENLRIVPRGANAQNQRSQRGSTSRFRGVSWSAKDRRWVAKVGREHLGQWTDELAAARAADARRREVLPFAVPDPELAALGAAA